VAPPEFPPGSPGPAGQNNNGGEGDQQIFFHGQFKLTFVLAPPNTHIPPEAEQWRGKDLQDHR
jgi:hypothetical protein